MKKEDVVGFLAELGQMANEATQRAQYSVSLEESLRLQALGSLLTAHALVGLGLLLAAGEEPHEAAPS